MKTIEKEKFLLVEDEAESLTDFTSEITRNHDLLKDSNVVVDLRKHHGIQKEHILGFLEVSNFHRNLNRSFVIVNDAISIDELPDELIVVPTLQEAEDMIQMDEIQRDLGF
ncbi:ribonuclease Z [Gramella sp. GC03-9]|uniref:Ribonuclease Z n=1 Tax=Christiangramia oceanisediminis TaxID=2920386 RepID=A0A9X2R965_9FLAO|nr:ribonuclease Z [Gramella oceanisediminis]MCP9200722.1 ribonuclease Z [Gramella oceanisediminis]